MLKCAKKTKNFVVDLEQLDHFNSQTKITKEVKLQKNNVSETLFNTLYIIKKK